ncbi:MULTISPECIES: PAQR family membrane homeostasis protein TrhA [Photobacterium]|uniref:Hemolysin n=2 Tax=Photobacterium TaxID=657 RepID=Q6LLI8_PHOPR|nr:MULTISPECIES: hemolysin III family protein [Photobacterium]PSU47250.1 hemolysin III family protein [Photobacterium frigidiphilum]CAG21840.1 Putative Hemolysin [Photobacterium profundum SS9]
MVKSVALKQGYSVAEEIANSVSHGLGLIFGIVGLVLLLNQGNAANAGFMSMASLSIYGSSIILLYLASTLYHAIPYERAKRALKTFDHSAIFLLIAGTYTPFLLISLRTPLAITLMSVIWGLAIIGIALKIIFVYRFKRLSLITYLTMGWLSVIVIYQLAISISTGGLVLLGLGGVIYSLGVFFYVNKRIPYNHAIWHMFVLGGTVCHFFAIYYYVKPI